MLQDPSTGTRGDTPLPDWITKAVADSAAEQAEQNALPPAEAEARAEYRRIEHENWLRLSANKRARGHGDCSHEADTAARQAVTTVRQNIAWRAAATAPRQAAAAPVPVSSTAVRPRERRDRSGRSSQRSGDSGSDDGASEPPPPGDWHWTQPAAWQPPAVAPHRYARSNRRDTLAVAA
jgi:hypothetical protein